MTSPLLRLLAAALSLALLSPAAAARADGLAPGSGVWPLQPRPEVVRGFEPPTTRWGAGHRGVDLLGRVGQPVHAAEPGTVTFAGRLAGRGVVVVDHGGLRTTYEPVAAAVHVGDPVAGGQVVGLLALAGSHCLPSACLHWGLIEGGQDGTYLDPLTLVGGGPVRLLPLAGALPAPPASAPAQPGLRGLPGLPAPGSVGPAGPDMADRAAGALPALRLPGNAGVAAAFRDPPA